MKRLDEATQLDLKVATFFSMSYYFPLISVSILPALE